MEQLTQWLISVTSYVDTISGGNMFMSAMLMSLVIYKLPKITIQLCSSILNRFTFTISINETSNFPSRAPNEISNWLYCHNKLKLFSTDLVWTGNTSDSLKYNKGLSRGTSLLLVNGVIIKATISSSNSAINRKDGVTTEPRATLKLTSYGLNSNSLSEIIDEAYPAKKDGGLRVRDLTNDERTDLRTYSLDERALNDDEYIIIREFIDGYKRNIPHRKKLHLSNKTGLLISGPPGNGKTSLAETIAKELGYHLIVVNAGGLTMDQLPYITKLRNSVVLFDEADAADCFAIKKERADRLTGDDNVVTSSIMQTFLDGPIKFKDLVFIFTTNFPERIDPSFKREGRIDRIIELAPLGTNAINKFIISNGFNIGLPTDEVYAVSGAELPRIMLELINITEPSEDDLIELFQPHLV